ncbi:dienelactone hydrolase family protein [Nostoc sp. FACHB-152]|uniref:dienelactone hydrolase family protein n=1 Tax=unclassified Nostoc TaxID=2593658 RepID=UPI00168422E2|nr:MULTISPECIES: dienelactone hydrolase family protein [unclassified Nostoc]MBD2451045.1 dienelactone hydrolase family protein [Nostoc sp. FACHB-152]MBD2471083.1 dienelactone hydrolase family protein [Nostoc sp. FACHB-145]
MKLLLCALITPVTVLLAATQTWAAIQTKNVEYKQGNTVLQGYLAYDDGIKGKRPGVLVVHEWNGLQSYAKQRTEQLAKLGYVAFAADIYGKGVRPKNNEEAGKLATFYRQNRQLLRDRALAGLKALQSNSLTDVNRIAAIGYCFGGGTVLELARSGANIAGVVSFHGNLDTPNPNDAKNIKAKVLVLQGANDPFVPPEQVQAFENEMRQANVDWQLISYGGAVHGFTNPENKGQLKGALYNPIADQRSWQDMRQFFVEIFRK